MSRYSTKQKLEALKRGVELPVDAYRMAHGEIGQVPSTDERAVLTLAREYQRAKDPNYVSISWGCQVEAANYFNRHGLIGTLEECMRLGGPEALL